MVATLPTPEPSNVGWVVEDYDELSSDLSIFIEVETFREEEPPSDPRVPFTYGPSRTTVRRSSYYGMIDEIKLDGPITYHHVQHPSGAITLLIGSIGGKPRIIARMLDTRGRDLTSTTPSRSKDMTEYIDETEYTDEELALALHAATYVRSGSIDINHDTSQAPRQIHTSLLSDLRAILKHLPKPQDDWQDVTDIRQIRRGDMLKNETENALIAYKYAVKRVNLSDYIVHLDNDELVFWHDNHTYYRIPAPVTPPDPALHQFIRVDGKDYKAIPESGRYQLLEAGLATVHVINRENITEWTELELVPKEVADND